MSSRSFRVFGTRKDLENIFKEFQNSNTIKYYKCGKSNNIEITDITEIDNFGISFNGSHLGDQYLVIKDSEIVQLDNMDLFLHSQVLYHNLICHLAYNLNFYC